MYPLPEGSPGPLLTWADPDNVDPSLRGRRPFDLGFTWVLEAGVCQVGCGGVGGEGGGGGHSGSFRSLTSGGRCKSSSYGGWEGINVMPVNLG